MQLDNSHSNILRITDVMHRTGLGRSTIYAFIKLGKFPRPVLLGERAVGWLESDIIAWLSSRHHRLVPAIVETSGQGAEQ